MAKMLKCEMCGAKTHHVVTKEFDGKVFNFCCRGCLEVYGLMRADGLVQTRAEEDYFRRTHRMDLPPQGTEQAGYAENGAARYPLG